jgi:hypothetical protein
LLNDEARDGETLAQTLDRLLRATPQFIVYTRLEAIRAKSVGGSASSLDKPD